MPKRREVWNSRNSTRPKAISFNGRSNTGSHTARMAASNSSARVDGGTQPASRWVSATRL